MHYVPGRRHLTGDLSYAVSGRSDHNPHAGDLLTLYGSQEDIDLLHEAVLGLQPWSWVEAYYDCPALSKLLGSYHADQRGLVLVVS